MVEGFILGLVLGGSCGSQVLSKISAFLRSMIGSAIVLHSSGLFAPPKVILSEMRVYNVPFQVILVADLIVACADRCCRQ